VRPYLENTHYKKGLAELLKVKALSSSPSTTHTKKAYIDIDSFKINTMASALVGWLHEFLQ
jgi:hypothetical protein